ncbi:MAG: PrpF family protein, partial [Deltaproteobacteria bacterium]|nr:PrpF family protein [Deltaproteobacteria bacterium]
MNVRGDQLVFPAVFMRGGTSKALIFKDADVPKDDEKRKRLFLAALGSPDPFGRQLDGLGGGLSSLSKICIVGPPSLTDADVDYTFAQVGIRDRTVDYGGNCGNMTSAIGPFAVDEGLVEAPSDGFASVRIHNTNTNKIILSTFPVRNCCAVVEGDVSIIGVAGRGAGIRLDFMAPGGTKGRGVLPAGEPLTLLELEAGASV